MKQVLFVVWYLFNIYDVENESCCSKLAIRLSGIWFWLCVGCELTAAAIISVGKDKKSCTFCQYQSVQKLPRSQLLTRAPPPAWRWCQVKLGVYSENRAPLWEGVRPIVLVSPTRQQSPHSTQAILDPTSPGLARPPHSIKRFSILCHTVTRPPGVVRLVPGRLYPLA